MHNRFSPKKNCHLANFFFGEKRFGEKQKVRDNVEMSSDDEIIGKKIGSGKRNNAQPADSDEAESEASDKDKSSE